MPLDLAIVGGGAAGLAAAVRAAADGLRVTVLERGDPGGDLRHQQRVEAVVGFPVGIGGVELAERAVAQARRFGAVIRAHASVSALRVDGDLRALHLADGSVVAAQAVILALGREPLDFPAPGLRAFAGSGLYFGIPAEVPRALRSGGVIVAGEPVAATRAAVELSRYCGSVTLLVDERLDVAHLPRDLAEDLRAASNIARLQCCEVVEAVGVERLEALVLRNRRSGRTTFRNAAAFFLLGVGVPRTSWLAGTLALDARGFIATGLDARTPVGPAWPLARPPHSRETSLPGVFAAGGVRAEGVGGTVGVIEDGIEAARQAAEYVREPAAAGSREARRLR